MLNLKRDTERHSATHGQSNLSFQGNGRVSVSVDTIVNSAQVKKQVAAVRDLAKFIRAKHKPK